MANGMTGAADRGVIDARPARPVSDGTLWDIATSRRDEITSIIRSTFERESIHALVAASARGTYPPWVKLEAWLPSDPSTAKGFTETERVLMEFVIDLKPYHDHEIVTSASLWRANKVIKVVDRPDFQVRDYIEWTDYALRLGPKPSNFRPFRDTIAQIIHMLLPFIPPPHRNRIKRDYKTSGLTSAGWLTLIGVAMVGSAPVLAPQVPLAAIVLGIGGLIALIGAAVIAASRTAVVALVGQPATQPRNLAALDRWHAVLAGLGRDYDAVHQRLVQAVTEYHTSEVECMSESYALRAPNRYEERQRIVVSTGQSEVHLHIAPMGDDMSVGWQASLNCAKWDETRTVSTRISKDRTTRFVEIRPAGYQPGQSDLIDLDSLSELVHRRLEREIKAILREGANDQEIDFRIIRGDRSKVIAGANSAGKSGKRPRRFWWRA